MMTNSIDTNTIVSDTWYKKWFDTAYYHKLYSHRNDKEAVNFLDELIGELSPERGSRMLDLGCGNGRHSKYLANRGFYVTGIDLSTSSIKEAKKLEKENLHFYRRDMRRPFGNELFDYVFNFFTSFGYFSDEADDHIVVSNISASLKTNGFLVMDYLNVVPAEQKLITKEVREIDGVEYKIERWMDGKFFYKKISVEGIVGGTTLEFTEQVRKFSLNDFEELFRAHELTLTNIYGDYTLDEYLPEDSPRMIMVARKV